jgi:hypothetical protein
MGIWMCQLFSVDELEALDQKQYEILKNEIRWQLESNKDGTSSRCSNAGYAARATNLSNPRLAE